MRLTNQACIDEVRRQERADLNGGFVRIEHSKPPPSREVQDIGRSCIMKSSDEPVKPLVGLLLELTRFSVFGPSLTLWMERAVGQVSWRPRRCIPTDRLKCMTNILAMVNLAWLSEGLIHRRFNWVQSSYDASKK